MPQKQPRLDIFVRLDPALRERVARAAAAEDRTVSNFIRRIVLTYMNEHYPEPDAPVEDAVRPKRPAGTAGPGSRTKAKG